MKFYLAPMEGITTYIYRNAHHKYFGYIDKYFTPFIAPNKNRCFNSKELNDIKPEHNKGITVIPQILTNKAEQFIDTAKKLDDLGYKEINLNLGCPSGTVVSKYKGSGFLAKQEELKIFLDEIYSKCNVDISIKTRIGKDSPEEFYSLLELYNRYPIKELIIHPRIQKDFYKNTPNIEIWKNALELSKNPICYNGDIFTKDLFESFMEKSPYTKKVMMGRGVLVNPMLVGKIKDNKSTDKKTIKAFHDTILIGYGELMSGDKNVLFRMKELWFYMIHLFCNHEKYEKKIKKSQSLKEYKQDVSDLLEEQEIKY